MTKNKNSGPFTTIVGAADYYAVSTKTIRRWIAEGRLPAYRVGNSAIRIKLSDLDLAIRPIPAGGAA